MYSFEEVLKSSKELFNGDELAADVYTNKYAMRNKKDELVELNSNNTLRRIAKEFARIEEKKFLNKREANIGSFGSAGHSVTRWHAYFFHVSPFTTMTKRMALPPR